MLALTLPKVLSQLLSDCRLEAVVQPVQVCPELGVLKMLHQGHPAATANINMCGDLRCVESVGRYVPGEWSRPGG
jgi:hypothetical protein